MNKDVFAVKGNIVFTPGPEGFTLHQESYLIVERGVVREICRSLPAEYAACRVEDYGDRLIIPGFVDLHTHASQFNQRGLGLDLQLLEWLNEYTFKEEARFAARDYAAAAYQAFAAEIVRQGTTRVVVFATIHKESSELLFNILARKGIGAYVGKVNMDRNCPDDLREETEQSLRDTEEIIRRWQDHPLVKPVITPRFAPTSTEKLLRGLGALAVRYNLPVQSHLSENQAEVRWVAELFPAQAEYHKVYDSFQLFGQTPTVMAHCIYLTAEAVQHMKMAQVMAVHCPDSNLNLASGIMPVRKMLAAGVPVGLGTDIGAGQSLFMPATIVSAIQLSKLYYVMQPECKPLTLSEAFYMATKGGGRFFGAVGSFEPGYSFDALIVDDRAEHARGRSLLERLQQFIYTGNAADIAERYIAGRKITV
ncbi:metal-dependent hydrolase [Lucifera butyrica]|uniref:Guanine deaminase n=1 Tax=Lucifera butyrica TaxID=1351585 RepID=A0A498RFT2_9FIRM|nr:guanine deaminase [Lucifera butyrica]VBB09875.1 metal-dependent hydrolase [Lucifera butyrica]